MKKIIIACLLFVGSSIIAQDYFKMSAAELDNALVVAVEKNLSDNVQKLIQAGANTHQGIHGFKTLLTYAAVCNKIDMVKQLVQKANHDEINDALVYALKRCDSRGRDDMIKELLQAGADVDQQIHYIFDAGDCDYDMHCTLLEFAAKEGCGVIVKEFIKMKPDNKTIDAALARAAGSHYADIVKDLVLANATIDAINDAFMIAAGTGHKDTMIELILAGADINQTEKADYHTNENTALIIAAKKGYISVIEELIKVGARVNHTNKNGDTALIAAAENGRAHIVKELIKAGAHVNHANNSGSTALILAKNTETTRLLLEAKANPNHINNNGDTALMLNIKVYDFDSVQALLQCPLINVNYADNDGNTALIIAIKWVKTTYFAGDNRAYNNCINSQKIIEILLQTPGINPHHANKKGETAVALLNKIVRGY